MNDNPRDDIAAAIDRVLLAGSVADITAAVSDLIRVLTGALEGDERAQVVDTLARVVREADTRLTPKGDNDTSAPLARFLDVDQPREAQQIGGGA